MIQGKPGKMISHLQPAPHLGNRAHEQWFWPNGEGTGRDKQTDKQFGTLATALEYRERKAVNESILLFQFDK
jgi:hypothetical protein